MCCYSLSACTNITTLTNPCVIHWFRSPGVTPFVLLLRQNACHLAKIITSVAWSLGFPVSLHAHDDRYRIGSNPHRPRRTNCTILRRFRFRWCGNCAPSCVYQLYTSTIFLYFFQFFVEENQMFVWLVGSLTSPTGVRRIGTCFNSCVNLSIFHPWERELPTCRLIIMLDVFLVIYLLRIVDRKTTTIDSNYCAWRPQGSDQRPMTDSFNRAVPHQEKG